jgi:hypothetical protein
MPRQNVCFRPKADIRLVHMLCRRALVVAMVPTVTLFNSFLAPVAVADTLSAWVAKNVKPNEKIVCSKEIGDEYFFVARAGSRFKVGNRLDVTGKSQPRSTAVAWLFEDSEGKSLLVDDPPVSAGDRYVRDGAKIFLDNLSYQTLKKGNPTSVRVRVLVRACAAQQCSLEQEALQEPKFTIRLCEFPMPQ